MIEVVAILDRSGSMSGDEKKVIDAYNEFINKQKNASYDCRVTLILFDDQYEEVYASKPVQEVPPLCEHVYFTRGMTALNDAVGKTINRFQHSPNAFFFIETDGLENSSKEFGANQIKSMIEEKQKKGWEFTFVGADLTQEQTQKMSRDMGISVQNTINVGKTEVGYATRNEFVSSTLDAYAQKVGENTEG